MQINKNFNTKQSISEKTSILLAEEHNLTAKIEKKNLEDAGFQVKVVYEYEDILNWLNKHYTNLLIIDYSFIKKENHVSLSKIKQVSLNKYLKIVLTSILPIKNQLDISIKNYFDLFLIKPLPRTKFIESLKKLNSQSIRNSERIEMELGIALNFTKKICLAKVLDVSHSGVHVIDRHHKLDLEVGYILKLNLKLPAYKTPISFMGTITRITKEGFGVKILKISKENQRKLYRFIDDNNYSKNSETYYL